MSGKGRLRTAAILCSAVALTAVVAIALLRAFADADPAEPTGDPTEPIQIGNGSAGLAEEPGAGDERPERLEVYRVTEAGQHRLVVYPLSSRSRAFSAATSYEVELTCFDGEGQVVVEERQRWTVNPEASALPHLHQRVESGRALARIARCRLTGTGSTLHARAAVSRAHPLDTATLPDTPTDRTGTPTPVTGKLRAPATPGGA